MILHYLRISLRNLRKYKTQTAISISAMAVSLTLMAIVSSIMLSFRPTPLLSQPYADKVEMFAQNEMSRTVGIEYRELIKGHQFRSVKELHLTATSEYNILVTANPSGKDEHTMMVYGGLKDHGYLNFLGEKSVYSGETVGTFKDNEVVITDWLAQKLFEDENPIGKAITLQSPYLGSLINEGEYIVKDVIERPSSDNRFLFSDEHLYIFTDRLPEDISYLYFVLRDGANREELHKELVELLHNQDFILYNVKETYDETKSLAIRRGIILFLFLFVLVAFSNYIRQQTQLFRLREREIALRTCVGSQPASLFLLFAFEITMVLILTLALALALIFAVINFMAINYSSLIDNYDLVRSYPIVLITTALLAAISMVVVVITVKRIRRDQTGLALRMKPQPKQRLRNAGLIVQMTISILFLWLTSLYFLTVDSIKDFYGIPDHVDRYKRGMYLNIKGLSNEDSDKIFARIDTLKTVERVYNYQEAIGVFDINEGFPNHSVYTEYYQNKNDIVDFYNLDIRELPGKTNPDRYVLINEEFKQMLIDKNQWNGKSLLLPYRDNIEFEVRGVFDNIPFKEAHSRKAVIVTDRETNIYFYGESNKIILPVVGKDKEARQAIEKILKEEQPTRIDIKIDNFFNLYAPRDYSMISAIIAIIYILSAISVITSMASIYAGVSLDTRRRRKEMALRKLNGAGKRVIAMIFVRTYIIIISVAALIALPLGLVGIPKLREFSFIFDFATDNYVVPYLCILLLIVVVTACTIGWKIRSIMKVDPVEYLKE